ncbi:Wzz/FepE/Etk N-terminal domain-containing protein [Poseidonibacter lekithochrous]|uniref:Wzz/FepE/Etk N-terminal domain-containing protein n=1 Tax=Poseidonibacter lekithochrous TaxID=1904463 RepID=UPI0008FCAEB6|nr:Wzz/FepE/Etk N-terminal domain-containing protein [Poseidonibacter lekithochrous]QKJ22249.1 putative chain length determinant protein, Wzz family [Poseidonibacter lekithochrous]
MVENKNNLRYVEEDEIDLKELFNTILKYKYKIALFVSFITILTFIYTLSIPNLYKSEIVLSPQESQKSVGGGLSSLASLAGVSLGGGSSKDPFIMMKTTLNDYLFNEKVIKKYNLIEKLETKKNLVFALNIDSIYNMFNSKSQKTEDKRSEKEKIFSTINSIKSILSIASDKKSSLIIIKAELVDRYMAKELVDIYLTEIINKIKLEDMKEIDAQIKYYNKELSSTYDVSLKEQLSKSLSGLYQKKVFSQANDYYFVSKVVDSRVSYIKEKTKPKRALILIVSFMTSIFLAIFIVFFLEFLRSDKENETKNS